MKKIITLLISLVNFFSVPVFADEALLKTPEVQSFIQEMIIHDHFNRADLEAIFRHVHPMPEVIHHMQHPAEGFPWDSYKNLFVTQTRITNGIAFSLRHKVLLQQSEKKYGVPAEIITAILGVESNYGTHAMKYLVIDALSNLAFNYPSRQIFFTSELKSYLNLVRKYHLNINDIYGSYAGAIGPAQFMPDSVLSYAVIENNDLNLNDASHWIPSIANFFTKKGWRYNEPIVTSINCASVLPDNIIPNSSKHFYSPKMLKEENISNKAQADAMYIEFKSSSGTQCWLAYHNFAVIMRYNTSPLYAMAVVQLSDKLKSSFGNI